MTLFDPGLLVEMVRGVVGDPQSGRVEMLPIRLPDGTPEFIAEQMSDDPLGYSSIDALAGALVEHTGIPHAVMVSSGTAALHLALRAAGVGPGDVVVVPALGFIAVANAVRYCGAQPLIVDCCHAPFGAINAYKLGVYLDEIAIPIKALVAVDMLGHRCVTHELVQTCAEFGIPIIEDAAAALGSSNIGRDVLAATVSFNCNKIVTTGGGGAVLTDNPVIAKEVLFLATTAKKRSRFFYEHTDAGFNYRMPNVCAAMGLPQMGQYLRNLVNAKRRLARQYYMALDRAIGTMVRQPDGECSNYWLNAIMLDPRFGAGDGRGFAMAALHSAGFGCRAMFTPLHMQAPYAGARRMENLQVAEDIFRRTICLPSGV